MQQQVIEIPSGVNCRVLESEIEVAGPKGSLKRPFNSRLVTVLVDQNRLLITGLSDGKVAKKSVNTLAAHVQNLIKGSLHEFEYHLSVVYSHFPMAITKKANAIEVTNYLGSKHPKRALIVGQTRVEIKGKDIILTGPSKEDVGQTAANLERLANPAGKDRRIFQDGIYITKKGN